MPLGIMDVAASAADEWGKTPPFGGRQVRALSQHRRAPKSGVSKVYIYIYIYVNLAL